MEHFKNQRNVGERENPDGVSHIGNTVCGDIMKLYIKANDSIVIDAKFKTFGCGGAMTTSSMLTELIKGKSKSETLEISNKTVTEALEGLPPPRMHYSVLAKEALQSAIDDYLRKVKGE
jgi:nitrogen fixation NifU-like protein